MGGIAMMVCFHMFLIGVIGVGALVAALLSAVKRRVYLRLPRLFEVGALSTVLLSLFCLFVLTAFFLMPRQGLRLEPPMGHKLYVIGFAYFTGAWTLIVRCCPVHRAILATVFSLFSAVMVWVMVDSWYRFPTSRPVGRDYLLPACLVAIHGGFAAHAALQWFVKRRTLAAKDVVPCVIAFLLVATFIAYSGVIHFD